jgi:hypothetical protein
LIQEAERLRRTIEVAWQSVQSLEQSALSAARLKDGPLDSEREAWIRATVRSKDQVFLDSLYIDLEVVTNQIASLTSSINTEITSQESQA